MILWAHTRVYVPDQLHSALPPWLPPQPRGPALVQQTLPKHSHLGARRSVAPARRAKRVLLLPAPRERHALDAARAALREGIAGLLPRVRPKLGAQAL